MSKWTLVGPAIMAVVALSAAAATAQGVGPRVGGAPGSPTVSPYINLLRGANSPALNYYGLVRPQLQTNAGLMALQQQAFLSQAVGLPAAPDEGLVTGRGAVFMNLGGYFQSATGAVRPGRTTAGPTAVGQPVPRLPAPGPR